MEITLKGVFIKNFSGKNGLLNTLFFQLVKLQQRIVMNRWYNQEYVDERDPKKMIGKNFSCLTKKLKFKK